MAEISFSIPEMWASMGVLAKAVALILILLSVYSIGIMIDRVLILSSSRKQSLRFLDATTGKLAELDYREVIPLSGEKIYRLSPLARIMKDGALEVQDAVEAGASKEAVEVIKRAMDRRLSLETTYMRRGLNSLATIGATAPFIGLFGTVMGIINAFRGMAVTGSGGLGSVSAGIAEALIATALGLGVAIPAVWAYNAFTQKVENLGIELSNFSSILIDFYEKNRERFLKG